MKNEQALLNNEAMVNFETALLELEKTCEPCKKLRSCNASVWETENYYILQSYRTFVACISKKTDICYDVLRIVYGYTNTSAQHISKFKKNYGAGKWGCETTITAR